MVFTAASLSLSRKKKKKKKLIKTFENKLKTKKQIRPSPSSSPPFSDWRSLADSHAATAFLTVPSSVSGRPRASLTVAGTASAAAAEASSAFPAPPSPAAA